MKRTRFLQIFFIMAAMVMSIYACKKEHSALADGSLPSQLLLDIPSHFPKLSDVPDNPLTVEGVALGRKLFYDTRLSGNNTLSCASCHDQSLAFSDGKALSTIGANGKKLLRHAPALFNLAWAKNGLFWDGGATNLESQAFAPLASEDEMHQNLTELEAELGQDPIYSAMFQRAFASKVKAALVVKAIAQFERTMISGKAKYDQYLAKTAGVAMSANELKGMNLVQLHCASCHSGALFTDNSFHNNGLSAAFSNAANEGIFQGRFRISYDAADLGKFKTPSLRNVALTAPYMHDGSIMTLNEVLDHYATGIKVSPTTDAKLLQNGTVGIPLTKSEQQNIIAFLKTLTDEQFIHNQQLSNPNSHEKDN